MSFSPFNQNNVQKTKTPMKRSVRSLRTPFIAMLMLCSITQLWADYATTLQALNPAGYWRFNETAAAPPINKVANLGSLGSAADGFIVLDVAKGAVPVLLLPQYTVSPWPRVWIGIACGIAAILGHTRPAFLLFRVLKDCLVHWKRH